MDTHLHIKRCVLLLLLSLLLLSAWTGSALAEEPVTEVNRFNVVLVVDKSGSLRDAKGHGTDPDGLRYDAMRLFLGLLTESGNNVGAVVFDEQIRYDSGLRPMDSMEDKKALIREVEAFAPSYDTDIGSAVLRATELLRGMREENGLPCMILLLTDGKTDFDANRWNRVQDSWATARQALAAAKEEGITIHGILLNVDGQAEDGRIEFELYTQGTDGAFEEVSRPEDLAAAFRRFYAIINNTVYTGAQRVAFSGQGEAEISFVVPSFGVEEVNVVVEGDDVRGDTASDEGLAIDILRPSGDSFDIAGRDLASSRYLLVKIPHPNLGIWNVRLKGAPDDWADVTMVYNASMSVTLLSGRGAGSYRAYMPYQFSAVLIDPSVEQITVEQLRELNARLRVEELADGFVREYPMEPAADGYSCEISFPKGGDYRLSALVGLGDFEVQSDSLELHVETWPLVAKVTRITDMLQYGRFADGCWELELAELFGVGDGVELSYTLSDDHDGVLSIEDGVLRARVRDTEPLSFTLTVSDQMDQSASIAFELAVPAVTAKLDSVSDMLRQGDFQDHQWEMALDALFDDPKNEQLQYTLSDDLGGAVTLTDGTLRVDLHDLPEADFTLSAEDLFGLKADIPFTLRVPGPSAAVGGLAETVKTGLFQAGIWEHSLTGLFRDPKGTKLTYTLSDDFNGAVKIEDSMLRVDAKGLKEAAFSLEATDEYGLRAELPVTITEKNMTPLYLLIALAALLVLCLLIALIRYLRRR